MTQIYLAGKIAKSDWRHNVAAELRDASTERSNLSSVGDLPGQIGTRYDGVTYVGPFFAGCDHGCAHGGDTHARSGGCTEGHSRPRTAADCLAQIDRADVVFAWLDELEPNGHCTAYGTLVEVGYAVARGKHVVVGASQAPQEPGEAGIVNRHPIDDVWFAWTVAHQRVIARSPLAALDEITAGGRAWQ
jgi:hypothetical protein